MLLLHHALFAPVCLGHTRDFVSWGMRDPHTLNLCPAVRSENWRTRRELQQAVPALKKEKRTSWHCARAKAPPLIELRVRNGGKCWYPSSSSLRILFSET